MFLIYAGGCYALEQRRYDVAEQMLCKSKEVFEKKLGSKTRLTLESTSFLAQVLQQKGLWDEAEKLQVQVVEARKAKLGPDHPDMLRSMNDLAFIWKDQGRHADA